MATSNKAAAVKKITTANDTANAIPTKSVFELSDEILKKHLPEGLDMLASRHDTLTKITQQLEQDFIAASRDTHTSTTTTTTTTNNPTSMNNLQTHKNNRTNNTNQNKHNSQVKSREQVVAQAASVLQTVTSTLCQDLDRVASDLTQCVHLQSAALDSLSSDVHLLATRMGQLQRFHYEECTVQDMMRSSTFMMNSSNSYHQQSQSQPQLDSNHNTNNKNKNSNTNNNNNFKNSNSSSINSGYMAVRELPLAEVLPAELYRRYQEYEATTMNNNNNNPNVSVYQNNNNTVSFAPTSTV